MALNFYPAWYLPARYQLLFQGLAGAASSFVYGGGLHYGQAIYNQQVSLFTADIATTVSLSEEAPNVVTFTADATPSVVTYTVG